MSKEEQVTSPATSRTNARPAPTARNTKAAKAPGSGRAAKANPGSGSSRTTATRRRPTTPNAATQALAGRSTGVDLPVIGHLDLPPTGSLAYYGAIALMAGLGLLEWPVAAAVAAGHFLAQQHGNRLLEDFGKGLEDT